MVVKNTLVSNKLVTFVEAENHTTYRMVTEPIEKEIRKRGYRTEVINPVKNEKPHKDSELIVTNYFWILHKLKEIYDIRKLPVAYISHGLSVWKYFNSGYQNCDYVFLTAEFERNKLFSLGGKHPDDSHTILTGWSKLDLLYNKNKNKQKIKEKVIQKLGLNKDKPIVAFLPTFTHGSKERIRGSMPLLSQVNTKELDNFIVAVHNFDKTKGMVKNILSKQKYIWDEANKYDLMIAADIIVGDISSIMVEALPLDKPIVHFLSNKKSLGIYECEKYGDCILGEVCTDPKKLVSVIKNNLEKDKYSTLREEWKKKLIYNFGTSTKTIADKIENILQ